MITLYTYIHHKDWDPAYQYKGIKAGDVPGESSSKPAILVTTDKDANFSSFDETTGWVRVKFEIPLTNIFIDWDDCDFMFPNTKELYELLNTLGDEERNNIHTYEQLMELVVSNSGSFLYGAYVTTIYAKEIKDIDHVMPKPNVNNSKTQV